MRKATLQEEEMMEEGISSNVGYPPIRMGPILLEWDPSRESVVGHRTDFYRWFSFLAPQRGHLGL